MKQHNFRLFYF